MGRGLYLEPLPFGNHGRELPRHGRRGDSWEGNNRVLLVRARAATDRLDDPRELAERPLERAHVALAERARRDRDEHQTPERRNTGVERNAGHGAHRGDRVDQPRHVAVPRRTLDQIGAAIEQPVKRHVPGRRVPVPHAPQPLAALVRQPDLRRESQQGMSLVEEADRSGPHRARLENGTERQLERILGRGGRRCDLLQLLAERYPGAGGRRREGGRRPGP